MTIPKENITMKRIAEEAGVTLTTVSRILNHKGGKYADHTKEKVFNIAKRLKYRPNALVRGMQTGKTGTAGVMIPTSNFFYAQLLSGIHEEFINHDTIMLLSWNNRSIEQREEEREREIIHQMVDRRVEGIILRPSSEEFELSYFEEIWERNIPLILIDREIAKIRTHFVGTDDHLGGRLAAEHLVSLGHRKILFVGVGDSTSTSRYREDGFRKVLSESPNASCRSMTMVEGVFKEEFIQVLNESESPTAIFCYNDDVAREVAKVILELGLTIPGDISLVGFGNVPTNEWSINLTTFDQHPSVIGRTAATMYLDRVNSGEQNGIKHELVKPTLLSRNSTQSIS